MLRRGPLAQSYPGAVSLVVLALVPYLSLTAAVLPLAPLIGKSLHLSPHGLDITIAMSTAAYAFGTVLAVQLATHLPARRLLLVYVSVFVAAASLAAWAPDGGVFIGGFVTEGLCTSLMLIAAVPPLVTGFGAEKMPTTGMVMNLCIFGAVAVGPTIGAVLAAAKSWQPLFAGVAGVGLLALVFAVLTYEDRPPVDTSAPWDVVAIVLAAGGCALAFFGAGELQASGSADAGSLAPLLVGTTMIGALVGYEYRTRHPLMPVKQLATTLPLTGILIAACASAASFGLMELVLGALEKTTTPTTMGLLFLPEFGAAVATAAIFGALFRTRFTPVLAICGLLMIVAAAALFLQVISSGGPLIALGAGLLGLGVGGSVSPALFVAGFSLRSSQIQRVFALVELLRGVTAFLIAPVLVFLATALSPKPATGLQETLWICLGIAAAGALGAMAMLWAGGVRLQVPDLDRWQETEPAWESPPPFAKLRRPPAERASLSAAGREDRVPERARDAS